MSEEFSKISKTAIYIAQIRAKYTNIPYSKEIVKELKKYQKNQIISKILLEIIHFIPSISSRFIGQEIRYISTNKAIEKEKPDMILELSAGFSSRGLVLAKNYDLYLETDLSEVTKIKTNIVKNLKKNRNLKNEILNPLEYNRFEEIGKKYFQNCKNKKIAIIQEGLITYFTKQEQKILRDNIAKFLEKYSPNGVWITPDFSYKKKENGAFSKILKHIQKQTNRKYNFFENNKEVQNFLEKGNLNGKILENKSLLNNLSSLKKLSLNSKIIIEIANDFKPWIIKLK